MIVWGCWAVWRSKRIEVLQSQLFILKVLSIVMAKVHPQCYGTFYAPNFDFRHVINRSTDLSFRDFEDDLSPPSLEHPTPVKVKVFRNQASVSSVRSERVHIKAYIPIAATNAKYEKTHLPLVKSSMFVNSLIAKYIGRVVFHISTSNWSVFQDRLSGKISYLAAHPELQPDTVDLQLMAHSLIEISFRHCW